MKFSHGYISELMKPVESDALLSWTRRIKVDDDIHKVIIAL